MAPFFFRWRRAPMKGLVEAHFWSLTRYRIGPRFLGLDYADNVIFFPAYRKKGWGGWAAVTLGATQSRYFTSDTSAANVLEDGYPLHWRASSKLQTFMAEEKKTWQARREEELVRRTAEKVTNPSNSAETPDASASIAELHDEQRFRDALTIKCTSPGFSQRHLRLGRAGTLLYKMLYFYLWGIAVSLVVQAYLMFRSWLNPPARAGLRNLEEHVLHIPKLLFSLCVRGVALVVQRMQPVVEPLLQMLEERFPQVDWNAASPDSIASRAQHLAGNEAAAQQAAALAEARAAARRKRGKDGEEERRVWWTRALMVLLAIFSIFCVL